MSFFRVTFSRTTSVEVAQGITGAKAETFALIVDAPNDVRALWEASKLVRKVYKNPDREFGPAATDLFDTFTVSAVP